MNNKALLNRAVKCGYITDAEFQDLSAKLKDEDKIRIKTNIEGRDVELFKNMVVLTIDYVLALYFDAHTKALKEKLLEPSK